jgi:SOS response regulatory protein OraA/RecX
VANGEAARRGGSSRPRKPSIAERRDRRRAVDDVGEVVDAAARLLEARPRSVAEVRRRLMSAGYRGELVAAAIERLTSLRYLDDEAFARGWVESRDRAHPRGEHALRRELALKGVERDIVDVVLADRRERPDLPADEGEAPDGPDGGPELAAADRLLGRRAAALLRETDPRRRRARAYALLARNGFDPETASLAATRFVAGAGAADQD